MTPQNHPLDSLKTQNNLQIVASLLNMQATTAGAAAPQFRDAAARINAIAAVHKQLHKSDYIGTVQLGEYLTDLCQEIAIASNIPDHGWSLINSGALTVANDIAVPLALIVNELLTNAIQHSEGGAVEIAMSDHQEGFSVSVSDAGPGPDPTHSEAGLGTRLVDALVRQINATIAKQCIAGRYAVTITVPTANREL